MKSEFPTRIMDILVDVARRTDTEFEGPWTDGLGEPLQDDADAAIKWIADRSPRCPYCDGSGDVHRADGEWLGTCTCPAGAVQVDSALQEAVDDTAEILDNLIKSISTHGNYSVESMLLFLSHARESLPASDGVKS